MQPDSIIPSPASPQSWNRFSYVMNSPIRYNDPSGHVCSDPDDPTPSCESGGSAVNPQRLGDSVVLNSGGSLDDGLKQKKPKHRTKDKDKDLNLLLGLHPDSCTSYTSCLPELQLVGPNGEDPWNSWLSSSYPWSFPVAGSWGDQGPQMISSIEFERWLRLVGEDLQTFPTLGWYDTPLFNAGGRATGVGCLETGGCYDRSELNYIGEGEALAKMGFSLETTHKIVYIWKAKGAFALGLLGLDSHHNVSPGTYEMTTKGWQYYNDHYGDTP